MDFILEMLNLQFTLFALIVIGIITKRAGIITGDNRRSFSALLIKVVLPSIFTIPALGLLL